MSLTDTTAPTQPQASDLGTILVAPHQFPALELEQQLADEFGVELVVAADAEQFRREIPRASLVLVTPYARVEEVDFAAMQRCIAVVRYGIGYDNIDTDAGRRHGVPVSIVPGAATEEVAMHAFTLGLTLARRIPAGERSIAAGGWAGTVGLDAPRFSEMDVAIIGMGRIGRRAAEWYAAIGARVRAYDPFTEFTTVPAAPLEELLENSDIVSLHLPLSAETRNLVSADVLARMRKGTVVVNVSRGGLVDEVALAEALHSGHIAGAGLDTFSTEPVPGDHPLRDAPNAILTPHVAWRSDKALATLQEAVVHRARLALTGQPLPDLV